jgi:hypothetical protein
MKFQKQKLKRRLGFPLHCVYIRNNCFFVYLQNTNDRAFLWLIFAEKIRYQDLCRQDLNIKV